MFILSFVLKRLMKLRTFLVLNKVRVSAACPNIATEPPIFRAKEDYHP